MKDIVIFGAGHTGEIVYKCIGAENIRYFADSRPQGTEYLGIELISFDKMLEIRDDIKVIVASYDFAGEMCSQLRNHGIFDYLVWRRETTSSWPIHFANGEYQFSPIIQVLKQLNTEKYSRLAICAYESIREFIVLLLDKLCLSDRIVMTIPHGDENNEALYEEFDCLILGLRRGDNNMPGIDMVDDWEEFTKCAVIDLYDAGIFMTRCTEIEVYKNKYKLYSREHGFRIYNATRGGELEAFERVDFDLLMGQA